MAGDDEKPRPIIKKIKKVEGGGHHGGAWKVAYADFATAMMAFFMLLWLLNVAPPETLAGLADYFAPTTAAVSGRSGVDAINAPTEDSVGSNPSPAVLISNPGPPQSGPTSGDNEGADSEGGGDPTIQDVIAEANRIREQEDVAFEQMQERLRLAIQQSPTLSELQDQLILEVTEDGMKIQLHDKDRRAMFRKGSDELYNYARDLLSEIGRSVQDLPNRITIQGHTDGGSFTGSNGSTNWELSADRANSARRVLDTSGVTEDRFFEVIGKAGTDPLYPDQPTRTENRRITILVLREAPVVPPNLTGGN
ncbi:flagellar motor protein MotB [Kordiimonas aquimaris]|uniref:flagellar motor protein MotB n=1 Tax=Kordiimonas aquimaris TaxID=707591 RepID=UPI0021D02E57|nr:flagellar motor protein MotB [Kordiimonas aquimaris]